MTSQVRRPVVRFGACELFKSVLQVTICVVVGIIAVGICVGNLLRAFWQPKQVVPTQSIEQFVAKFASLPTIQNNAEIARALQDVIDWHRQDETCLGIEILCSQLFEYSVPLTEEFIRDIESLAKWYGVAPDYVRPLKTLLPVGPAVLRQEV